MTEEDTQAHHPAAEPDLEHQSGRQVITPQPKSIVNLSNRLGPRPAPASEPSASEKFDEITQHGTTHENQPGRGSAVQSGAGEETDPLQRAAGHPESPPSPSDQVVPDPSRRTARRAAKRSTKSVERDASASSAQQRGASPPEAYQPRRKRPNTVFYVSIGVSDQLRDFARRRNKTNADVIFDAIEANLTDLPALLSGREQPEPSDDGVFARTRSKPVGHKVQLTGVVHDSNLAVIDRLVEQYGADSRSHLVEVALRAYLSAEDLSAEDLSAEDRAVTA